MERRHFTLERHQDIFLFSNVLNLSATLGHLFASPGQQVQQNPDRQVRLPPDLPRLLHDVPHPDQLYADLSDLRKNFSLSVLERVGPRHLAFRTSVGRTDFARRSDRPRSNQNRDHRPKPDRVRNSHISSFHG